MTTERSYDGVGRQTGPRRLDWGDDYADLTCDQCGATWTGRIDSPCQWCRRSLELLIEHQRDLLRAMPDVDPDDERYRDALTAWGRRIALAVTADLISEHEGRLWWQRATQHDHAA